MTTVCVTVDDEQRVGGGWGRARRVALADVVDGAVVGWHEEDVRWDESHDDEGEGKHHARIVRFLRDNGVEVVVTGHMGPPMQHTLGLLGVRVVLGAVGDAREAAVAAA